MSRAALLGAGAVSAAGSGLGALRAALAGRRPEPTPVPTAFLGSAAGDGVPLPVLLAKPEGLERFVAPLAVRRVDRFSQRMLLAAFLALEDAATSGHDPERLGLVVATGYGPLSSTFAFLDDMIDKRDALTSPILFAGSVHNTPAANISAFAQVRGPTLTVTGFSFAFAEALAIATDWLDRGRVDRVLLVAGDEFHPVGAYALGRLGPAHAGGRLRPLDFERCSYLPGESYAAMLLGRTDGAPARHGTIHGPQRFHGRLPEGEGPVFLCSVGQVTEGPAYREAISAAGPVAAYSPLWGGSPTSDAHTVLAAMLALEDRKIPELPEPEPVSFGLTALAPGPTEAHAIRCVSVDAGGRGVLFRVAAE